MYCWAVFFWPFTRRVISNKILRDSIRWHLYEHIDEGPKNQHSFHFLIEATKYLSSNTFGRFRITLNPHFIVFSSLAILASLLNTNLSRVYLKNPVLHRSPHSVSTWSPVLFYSNLADAKVYFNFPIVSQLILVIILIELYISLNRQLIVKLINSIYSIIYNYVIKIANERIIINLTQLLAIVYNVFVTALKWHLEN